MTLVYLLIAIAQAFLFALFFFPALRWSSWSRALLLIVLAVPVALSPLWIPLGKPFIRLLAAMNATAVLAKLYDLHVSAKHSVRPSFPAFTGEPLIADRRLQNGLRRTVWVK